MESNMVAVVPKPIRGRGRPPEPNPLEYTLSTRVTEAHFQALEKLRAMTRRTRSMDLLLAIEAYLVKHKLWPPE
jgi:hypothetical protein